MYMNSVGSENCKKRIKKMRDIGKQEREKKNEKNSDDENCGKKYNKLMSYDELPDYMKDNQFILNYYRANWPLNKALLSLFQLHNETINIWTHLIGFVVFVWLTVANAAHVSSDAFDVFGIFRVSPYKVTNSSSHQSTNLIMGVTKLVDMKDSTNNVDYHHTLEAERWPFYVYLSGSMFCLLSSTLCHLFCCHSHRLNLWLLRLDYTGITVMIITSFFPPIYYIFLCQPIWQIVYLTGISLFGAFTIVTLLSPTLSSGKCRAFRAILFVSMGLLGVVPAIHIVILNWSNPRRNVTVAYEATMALSYLIGTGFYVSRIPERWRPGWFDLAGHSHQIFHVFVVVGALAHYGAALMFLEYRDQVGCSQ